WVALEMAARTVPVAHGTLRDHVLRPAYASFLGISEGAESAKHVPRRRPPGRSGRLLPAGALFSRRSWPSTDVGLYCRRGPPRRDWRSHAFLGGVAASVRLVRDPYVGGRGRARYRLLDSEHHMEHTDAGRGQISLRLYVFHHVRPALHHGFHPEACATLAGRHSLLLRDARLRRAALYQPHRDVPGRDARTRRVCFRQDVLLADDARRGERPLSADG